MFFLFFSLVAVFACTNNTSACSNNGNCVVDQPTNSTRCICNANFFGANCQDFCSMICFKTECSQNGICALVTRENATRCVCDSGLEFFVGFTGAANFYIGDIVAGVFKILLFLLACFCACLAGSSKESSICRLIAGLLSCALTIWIFVFWIMILAGAVNDSDGYMLNK